MRKAVGIICAIIIVLTVIIAAGHAASLKIETEEIDLDAGASGVRILQVSDAHFPRCFLSASELSALIASQKPDCIVFTGDVADGEATKDDVAALKDFFLASSALCPCFLVIGNHEIGSDQLDFFDETARKCGITVLLNEIVTKKIKNIDFAFIGLSDGYLYEEKTFVSLPPLVGKRKILLSHRPEKFETYASAPASIKPDVVFSGHAHGGLFRMGNSALYAPNQGLFPKYTSGLYEKNGVKMIVSRGLGVSGVDFRCFNKYHLPVVTIS